MTKLFLTFLIGVLLCLPLHQADSQTVDIPDANLRAAVESALSLSAGDPITETAMAGLTELRAQSVKDITGLEHATGLTKLTIRGAFSHSSPDRLVDISLLSALTSLTYLDLSRNRIVDISPLVGLSQLQHLNLFTNPITDISILTKENFPNLGYLNIRDTWVRDFSALDPDHWVMKYAANPASDPEFPQEGGSALLICNANLENWDYYNDNVGPPLGDEYEIDPTTFERIPTGVKAKTRLEDQLNKPTCAPVFGIESTGDNTSVRLVVDADADLTANYVTLGYVYRYRKSGDSWSSGGSEMDVTPQWTGGFVNPPPGEDTEASYQGVIVESQSGEYAAEITGLDPSAVYHFQVFGSVLHGGGIRALYPPGSEIRCWSTSEQSETECPLPSTPSTGTSSGLTVAFEDYPEDKPTDEFTLTIQFSRPVIGFEKEDITVETELTRGSGTATLVDLSPQTPIHPDGTHPDPIQTYTATVKLPSRAVGTVRLIVRENAAMNPAELTGPAADTASEPIEFERRGPSVFPSYVAMDTIIFNEFRNATDDKNDWIELKNISTEAVSLKEWEISIIASEDEPAYIDRDIVAFPDYTLPPGGVLLILNTDPSENDLLHGQNLENPHHNPELRPWYLIRPEMKLPNTPCLLILRSARDKNGEWVGFEDLAGDYHRGEVTYRTQIWPLRDTWVYTGTGARFSEGNVYQRVMRPEGSIPMMPMERGYFHDAWVLSDYQSGLGYDLEASSETSLGTPGYAAKLVDDIGTGQISISEVMFATNEKGSSSQWIELYNNSATEVVNLEGWKLRVEVRDSQPVHRHITFPLKSLEVMPNQAVLLVSRNDRNSGNIPMRRIYDVQRQNRKALLLRAEGFALRLFSPDGALVDMVGNLDGKVGQDEPRWELPSGWSESGARSSLIRRYEDRVPARGTRLGSWVRAGDTALLMGYSYWGLPTDDGTPGYRQGSPLPVTLSSLRADLREGSVVVTWTTASELENAGFYVLRSRDRASGFVRVNPALIPGAGTTGESQTYTYRDTTASENVPYYYRLEEVSLSGERRSVATVRLRGHVSAANRLLWKWADVKTEN